MTTTGETTAVEARALRFSVFGYLGMGVLGLAFAFVTRSESILFDGVYSILNFGAAIVAGRVARLVDRPGDDVFPFGYAHFEPVVNAVRGMLILAVCVFAVASAVSALLHGGRTFSAGTAVVYGVLAAVLCIAVAANQRRLARRVGSPLLEVDARNWLIDGVLSGVVALAFVAAFLLNEFGATHVVPYVDPALVVLLVLLVIRMPLVTVWENLREVLAFAPAADVRREVRERIEAALADLDPTEIHLRPLKVGRTFYLLTHVLLPPESEVGAIKDLDAVRRRVAASLADVDLRVVADTIFTSDENWVHGMDHRLMSEC